MLNQSINENIHSICVHLKRSWGVEKIGDQNIEHFAAKQ